MSNSRFVILEGMDSTGKTSLAKFLARKMHAMYWHASGHKSLHMGMNAYHKSILQDVAVNLHNYVDVVLDRIWPSELAYASVLRPELRDRYDYKLKISACEALGAKYVYCCSDDIEKAWARYQETHKDHDPAEFRQLTREEYMAINGEYRGIFENVPHVKYKIEEHGHDLDKFCEQFL